MNNIKDIKARSKATKGIYESISLANRYIVFKSTDSGECATMVRLLLPDALSKELGKKYLTSTIKYIGNTPIDAHIEAIRLRRDQLFHSVTGEAFNVESLARYKKKISTKMSSELYGGIKVKKSSHQFAVHFCISDVEHVSYFSAFSLSSEEKAYLLACRFVDELNGEKLKDDAHYLSYKSHTYFPELLTTSFWNLIDLCSTIKGETKILMDGVELVAKHNRVGFFANTYNKLSRKQERVYFNALDKGEDGSFIAACMYKDSSKGVKLLSEEEYLKLKPNDCLKELISLQKAKK